MSNRSVSPVQQDEHVEYAIGKSQIVVRDGALRQPENDKEDSVRAYTDQGTNTHLRPLFRQRYHTGDIGTPEEQHPLTAKRSEGGNRSPESKTEPTERKVAFEEAIDNDDDFKDIQKRQRLKARNALPRKQHREFHFEQFQDSIRESTYKLGTNVHGNNEAVMHLINDALVPSGLSEQILGMRPTSVILKKCLLPYGTFTSEQIYKGNGRTVWKCQLHANNQLFVRKKQHRDGFRKNEIIVVLQLNHENIVKLCGLEVEGNYILPLLEYAGESLSNYISRSKDDTHCTKIAVPLIGQLLGALAYLANHGIIHADIKPQNICLKLNQNGVLVVKLIDFGSCITRLDVITARGWTAEYMAVETCRWLWKRKFDVLKANNPDADGPEFTWTEDDMKITPMADMFSFGLVILYIYHCMHVTRSFLHQSTSYSRQQETDYIIEMMTHSWHELSRFIDTAKKMPKFIKKLCRRMLTEGPDNRISAYEAQQLYHDKLRKVVLASGSPNVVGLPPNPVNLSPKPAGLTPTPAVTSTPRCSYQATNAACKPMQRTVQAVQCEDQGIEPPVLWDTSWRQSKRSLCISSGSPQEKLHCQRMSTEEERPEGANNLPNFDALL